MQLMGVCKTRGPLCGHIICSQKENLKSVKFIPKMSHFNFFIFFLPAVFFQIFFWPKYGQNNQSFKIQNVLYTATIETFLLFWQHCDGCEGGFWLQILSSSHFNAILRQKYSLSTVSENYIFQDHLNF